jgi:hypothetical protein
MPYAATRDYQMSPNAVLVIMIPAFLLMVIAIGSKNPLRKSKSLILGSIRGERAIRNVIKIKSILDMVLSEYRHLEYI